MSEGMGNSTRSELVEQEMRERRQAAQVAAGVESADRVLRNGRVVDVHTGRIRSVDVAIAGTRIAFVGEADFAIGPETDVVDCEGRFILPGFVETHFHVGGSQLVIERLAEVFLSRGTVAIATDFYEPAYIVGIEAAHELIRRAEATELEVFLSPSFFPATGNGACGNLGRTSFDEIAALFDRPDCIEIREWSYNVLQSPLPEFDAFYRRALSKGLIPAGHIEGRTDQLLQASAALGIRSDHEAGTVQDAIDRAQAGMIIEMRDGSGASDLPQLARAITEEGLDPRSFAFSTDEQELSSLIQDGHIDHKLRTAVGQGIAPIDAVRMATLTSAEALGITDRYGSVAPGRYASLVLVDDLAQFNVREVFVKGRSYSRNGELPTDVPVEPYPDSWRNRTRLKAELTAADFKLAAPDGDSVPLRVIHVTPANAVTREVVERHSVADGRLTGDTEGLAKMSMIDRHEASGRQTNALVRGMQIKKGAFANTTNAGVMNLQVVGVDDEDMAIAANRAAELGGGFVVAADGEVVAEMPLPYCGLFSEASLEESIQQAEALDRAFKEVLGIPFPGAITLAGYCGIAAGIPELKITDLGLARVRHDSQEFVDVVAAEA